MDYAKIGLKAGLEIHQQLDTGKLFSRTPSLLRKEKPDYVVKRRLHRVAGESGEVDVAVEHEASLDREFVYEGYDDTISLVELDEAPPREIDEEALDVALQIALLLNCELYPVAQIMRKTVIDGSNTSGFQRTVLIGHSGYLEMEFGKVGIDSVVLEEDAARIISRGKGETVYRLDRLGIPLIEIATSPDLKTGEQIKECALKLGEILRACKVKRGIGTIRQDVNISIKGHDRVEIKGFQDPKMMVETVDMEIERQSGDIRDQKKIGSGKYLNFPILENLLSDFDDNKIIELISLLSGKKAKTSEEELSGEERFDNLHVIYNFNEKNVLEAIEKVARENNLMEVVEEIKRLPKRKGFVEGNVRNAKGDGSTEFLRPLPGKARMYPETDLPLLRIGRERVNRLKKNLPRLRGEIKEELKGRGLSEEMINLVFTSGAVEEFNVLMKVYGKDAELVAKMITLWRRDLAKKSGKSEEEVREVLNERVLEKILEKVKIGDLDKGDVRGVLQDILSGTGVDEALKVEKAGDDELEEEIRKIIKEKPGLRPNAYMGLVMKKFSGKLDSKKAMEIINKIVGGK